MLPMQCVSSKNYINKCMMLSHCLYHDWFGFFCSLAGYIYISYWLPSRFIDSTAIRVNKQFVNLANHDISWLCTSTSGYMLFRYPYLKVRICISIKTKYLKSKIRDIWKTCKFLRVHVHRKCVQSWFYCHLRIGDIFLRLQLVYKIVNNFTELSASVEQLPCEAIRST